MATLVKCKSWKAMMDQGQDPREGLFLPIIGLIVTTVVGCVHYQHNMIRSNSTGRMHFHKPHMDANGKERTGSKYRWVATVARGSA